ncbi:hypothetical protein J7547_08150 [Wohlfahrtiimonas chitiniclastica]|uniref:Uncharacterized protein n=1 Tax=Wohlfahrtiimonas chitiniclastica TaxID=400946 RepID=A0AB35BY10_9GAMM|nr:hypothetical protein [Wohlfahrtiimonas chitiniclastica]MBS7825179.1 hypothetical protein [Wohlfahrtiimonas chitiniclastica]MBS7840791.1 hypothetical protein [Wohlfahrtiimonas chitiniclastica]
MSKNERNTICKFIGDKIKPFITTIHKPTRYIILFVITTMLVSFFLFDFTILMQLLKSSVDEHIVNNFFLIKKLFFTIILLIAIVICFISFIKNKYSIKVEQLSLGGINILFDRREILFINSVQNFFDTKRTLFCIDEKYDNFAEVFQSYYETYNFIRQEMKLLDPSKDKALYKLSNDILVRLNQFLTKNQNNYLRWYKYISETNQELIGLDEFDKDDVKAKQRHFYNMPINDIQSKYYSYNNLINEFKGINEFFTAEIAKKFKVDISKWEQKDSDQKSESE